MRQSDHGANVSSETAITLMTIVAITTHKRPRSSAGSCVLRKRHDAALASHAITVNHVGFAFVGRLYQTPLQSAYVLTRAASRC